ncbi:MAG: T9SS type A sorting domain-containing protein, partial [Bacteroidales bacterium]
NDYVTVSSPKQYQAQGHIEIYNIHGKLLNKFELGPCQDSLAINTVALMPGFYVVRVSIGSVTVNRVIVKNLS